MTKQNHQKKKKIRIFEKRHAIAETNKIKKSRLNRQDDHPTWGCDLPDFRTREHYEIIRSWAKNREGPIIPDSSIIFSGYEGNGLLGCYKCCIRFERFRKYREKFENLFSQVESFSYDLTDFLSGENTIVTEPVSEDIRSLASDIYNQIEMYADSTRNKHKLSRPIKRIVSSLKTAEDRAKELGLYSPQIDYFSGSDLNLRESAILSAGVLSSHKSKKVSNILVINNSIVKTVNSLDAPQIKLTESFPDFQGIDFHVMIERRTAPRIAHSASYRQN